jgi:hypothetical protein
VAMTATWMSGTQVLLIVDQFQFKDCPVPLAVMRCH